MDNSLTKFHISKKNLMCFVKVIKVQSNAINLRFSQYVLN